MISVAEALDHLFQLCAPLELETVPLAAAAGRVLGEDVVATRDQPPFAASAMDGYAVRGAEARPGTSFQVVGTAAAGHQWHGTLSPGAAVRIFTGAPVPEGADRIIIQEDVVRDGDTITLGDALDTGAHLRPAGGDFKAGRRLSAPCRLSPSHLALLAAMNAGRVRVVRQPVVALLATGDELVQPGEAPGTDQIIASNTYGLQAMLQAAGCVVRMLPIARDTHASLSAALRLAEGADLLVTVGGASVGDHDLVASAATAAGLERSFYKIAMRPGKPLMAGRMGPMAMVGLPGNPVSALVCGEIFLKPMVDVFLGLPAAPRARRAAHLAAPLGPNGPREHYMRAQRTEQGVTAYDRQDSSLLSVLADADCLIVRPANDPDRPAGSEIDIIPL
ncbi:MAG: gephyrin-like molybdotransferase Glp [Pseudomonadota bacterium]